MTCVKLCNILFGDEILHKRDTYYIKRDEIWSLYARDVSRAYPDGKVNLVIYAKPSAILYSGSNSYEQHINS